ncbi:uncharacterized protein LOC126366588 isoform X2 [Pectinophora gossypiella]|uniref:uncharacterized protein LOC126366588 isoform X2 n=1 Tax=Pectinophora gossypiella TaxID=13191 RepID=UPI00214EA697|nr:uncharacterized protein LOC126366588 isoform X2 [Pectinophora gossypiella]
MHAFPFPEELNNLAFQQPLRYLNYAQPQPPTVGQSRQHYSNAGYQPSAPSLGGVPYPSNLQIPSNAAFHNLINQLPMQQSQSYGNYFLPRQQTQTQNVQIQEQINEQIRNAQRFANQLRLQNVADQYLNPVQNAYQPNNNSPLYLPLEQELPRQNPSTQWTDNSENNQIAAAVAAAAANSQPNSEPASRSNDPIRELYHHLIQQHTSTNPGQPIPNPQLHNLLKQYTEVAPANHEKRYLVLHPNGSMEYVDHLEHIAKQHPNYVLVNANTLLTPQDTEDPNANPQTNQIPQVDPVPQTNTVQTNPVQQNNLLPETNPLTQNNIVPQIDTAPPSVTNSTSIVPASDPVPNPANPILSPAPVLNPGAPVNPPTPNIPNIYTQAVATVTQPKPNNSSQPTTTSTLPNLQSPPVANASKTPTPNNAIITPAAPQQPSDVTSAITNPSLAPAQKESPKSNNPVPPVTTNAKVPLADATTKIAPSNNSTISKTPQVDTSQPKATPANITKNKAPSTKTNPTKAPVVSSLPTNTTLSGNPNSKTPPVSLSPSKNLPSNPTKVPLNKTPTPKKNPLISTPSSNVPPSKSPTKDPKVITPSKPESNDKQSDLPEIPEEVKLTDSELLKKIFGNDTDTDSVIFVVINPVLEKDIKTVLYPNGTVAEEVTETRLV